MKQELADILYQKYPKIFRDRTAPLTRSLMGFGFEIGDGWFNIIDNACWQVQQHINHQRSTRARILRKMRKGEALHDWEVPEYAKGVTSQVVATQIKEKFGTLRFYYTGGDDYCDGVISMAEAMTSDTCEECGAPGKSGGGGWISVRCKPCREESIRPFMSDQVTAVLDETTNITP